MKAYNCKSKGQVSLEYLIIIGIGLLILSGFLAYTFYYSTAYNSAENGQALSLMVNSISGAVNYIGSQQTGSTTTFTFDSPGLNILDSYTCNNYLILASNGFEAAATLNLPVIGELPVNTGQLSGQVALLDVSGHQVAKVSFDLPVSFINVSYSFNSSNFLLYNLNFLSQTGLDVNNINFNISVYTLDNVLIASQNETAVTGNFSSAINLTRTYPEVKIIVTVPSLSIASSECFIPGKQLQITLLNPESIGTSIPFQQMLQINSSSYAQYEAQNLQDIQFSYLNSTIIPSWLESGDLATFNGESSFANMGQSLLLKPANSVTFSSWIDPKNLPLSGNISYLFSDSFENGSRGIIGYLNGSTLCLTIAFNSSAKENACANNINITTYNWTNYVWTYSAATGNLILYIDGNELNTTTSRDGELIRYPSNSNLLLGAMNTSSDNTLFNGTMSNVQMYSTLFSREQVLQLYEEGLAGTPIAGTDVLGWWSLAGNLNDLSGNGDGGINNNILFLGIGSASSDTVYWLKLDDGIKANSELIIDMNIYPASYNMLNNRTTGEAPQISEKYGSYDDGADVFDGYWNFLGSSVSSSLSQINPPGSSITVGNNEIQINTTTADYAGLISNATFPTPFILEADVLKLSGAAAGISQQTISNPYGTNFDGYVFSKYYYPLSGGTLEGGLTGVLTSTSFNFTTGLMGLALINASSELIYRNDTITSFRNEISPTFLSSEYIGFGIYSSSPSTSLTLRWVRVVSYPPNGIMPLAIIGNLV